MRGGKRGKSIERRKERWGERRKEVKKKDERGKERRKRKKEGEERSERDIHHRFTQIKWSKAKNINVIESRKDQIWW